jgi:hypothetical protein
MAVHYQFGFGFGTSAQIALYNGLQYEPLYDTSNARIVIMLGTGAGNMVPMASEAYVQSQIGAISAGSAANIVNYLNNT